MSFRFKKALWAVAGLLPLVSFAQNTAVFISGQDSTRNPITVAVPFLSFAPDSRGSAMGDAGVASSPDEYSVHYNNAKLAFIDKDLGFSFSYSPWLGNIVDDMSLNYLTFHTKISRNEAIGINMRYFDLGEIQLTDATGAAMGLENPRELAIDGTYSRKLSDNLGVGVTGRYIWSNLAGNISGQGDAKAGTSVAVDLGVYYHKEIVFNGRESELSFGGHMSNFGSKITYSTDQYEDFIPTNLRLGTAFKTNIDQFNSITFMVDFNKLMVPTPPRYATDSEGNIEYDPDGNAVIAEGKDPNRSLLSGTFGSFSDAPGGFSEEMQEIMISGGAEYRYGEFFALRAGYFHESKNKGNRKYFTAGVGVKYQVFGLDFSYLIPQESNNPLANTLRISLNISLDTKKEES